MSYTNPSSYTNTNSINELYAKLMELQSKMPIIVDTGNEIARANMAKVMDETEGVSPEQKVLINKFLKDAGLDTIPAWAKLMADGKTEKDFDEATRAEYDAYITEQIMAQIEERKKAQEEYELYLQSSQKQTANDLIKQLPNNSGKK